MDREKSMTNIESIKVGKELEEFLDNQELEIESYDEDLVRKFIDKIIVYDEDLKVVFKSGLEVEIEN